MYRAVIAAAIAGLALNGCAAKPIDAPSNYAWTYSDDSSEGAKLAFGRPQSDELVLMLVCSPGRSRVELSAVGLSSARLMLSSGQAKTSLRGAIGENAEDESGVVEASLPTRAPALDGFRRSGELTLASGGRILNLAAFDADRPAVKRFFGACQA